MFWKPEYAPIRPDSVTLYRNILGVVGNIS